MDEHTFRTIVATAWLAIPERFLGRVDNLALLVEDAPSADVLEEVEDGSTLLGLYRGIPLSQRGMHYGDGAPLPDTITLYRLPLMEEARRIQESNSGLGEDEAVRKAIDETLWHEVGHYFGLPEDAVHKREEEGTNTYRKTYESDRGNPTRMCGRK